MNPNDIVSFVSDIQGKLDNFSVAERADCCLRFDHPLRLLPNCEIKERIDHVRSGTYLISLERCHVRYPNIRMDNMICMIEESRDGKYPFEDESHHSACHTFSRALARMFIHVIIYGHVSK